MSRRDLFSAASRPRAPDSTISSAYPAISAASHPSYSSSRGRRSVTVIGQSCTRFAGRPGALRVPVSSTAVSARAPFRLRACEAALTAAMRSSGAADSGLRPAIVRSSSATSKRQSGGGSVGGRRPSARTHPDREARLGLSGWRVRTGRCAARSPCWERQCAGKARLGRTCRSCPTHCRGRHHQVRRCCGS